MATAFSPTALNLGYAIVMLVLAFGMGKLHQASLTYKLVLIVLALYVLCGGVFELVHPPSGRAGWPELVSRIADIVAGLIALVAIGRYIARRTQRQP